MTDQTENPAGDGAQDPAADAGLTDNGAGATDPAADKAAEDAGFADAKAKAELEAAAAKPKTKRKAAPRAKGSGFSVKAPTRAQYDQLCGMAGNGRAVQLVPTDGRKPIEGVRPAVVGTILRRGRPCNSQAASFTGASLEDAATISHVFALEADDKPTAPPLAIAELAAPIILRPGEQFKIDAGALSFFPPAERASAEA